MAEGSDGELAKVYHFPALTSKLTCMDCEYVMLGQTGLYCSLFKEELMSELNSEECEEFTPLPWVKEK